MIERSLRSLRSHHHVGGAPTWVLSSHDVPRHASRLALPAGVDPDDWLICDGRDPAIDLVWVAAEPARQP